MAQTQRKTLLPSNLTGFCIEKLVMCIERFNKGEIDADTSFKIEKQRYSKMRLDGPVWPSISLT